MQAHLAALAPFVGGLLAAGSTGDGWELDDARYRVVVREDLAAAKRHAYRVLIGALRHTADEVQHRIQAWMSEFGSPVGTDAAVAALVERRVAAFTICGPVGAQLPAAEINSALVQALQTGLPLSLYQLPQVTGYNLASSTVADLAARFPNVLLFKDTSGEDAVATAQVPLPGIFLVRGAEGDYLRWLGSAGGPYHGFLLSSANCFARQLREVLEAARDGRMDVARARSEQVSAVMRDLFAVVQAVKGGNAFANANKVGDHFMAYGPQGAAAAPPRLSTGVALPAEVLEAGRAVLARHQLLPTRGYLEV
jgi:dihydrodipicolinate synthase/N-acetylneuraminate lyase